MFLSVSGAPVSPGSEHADVVTALIVHNDSLTTWHAISWIY